MKTKLSLWLGWMGFVGLAVAALGDNQSAQKRQQRTEPLVKEVVRVPIHESPVIGYLEKRRQTITIKSGPQGTLYSIKTTEGKTLFENLSADQLRAAAPEIRELIRTAVASDSKKSSVLMDARVRAFR